MSIVRAVLPLFLAACSAFPTPEGLAIVEQTRIPDHMIVGVAVSPETGAIHVLDAWDGVYAVEDGTLKLVASPTVLERDGEDLRPFTDLVSLGDDQFAVTVRNDGLLLDLAAQTTRQHFCYLPGSDLDWEPQQPVSQLTHAVAYDPVSDVIFAQPQTFVGRSLDSAQVGIYDRTAGGQPEGWFELRRDDVAATGMIWDATRLVLAEGSRLSTYSLGDDRPEPFADLSDALGDATIEGMAVDARDRLVVVTRDQLVVLADWRP
jgi:hypothetical protein